MTNEELAGVDELVGRLKGRVRQRLPIDWQKNRQCPECGTAADRPKCMWELGGNCPRHDPENYDPSPFIEEPDPDCYAAVTVLQSLITTAREAEALRAENARLRYLLKRMCDAYELVCNDTGKPYHTSPSSVYAHARAALEQGEG